MNKDPHILFHKINEKALLPKRNNPTDAGIDLYSINSIVIPPLGRSIVQTGIKLEIPEGYYGRIAPRSGLAVKHGIDVLAGVIDSSYRGEVCVVLHNTDAYESYCVEEAERVAQLIIEKHYNFSFREVKSLSDTKRSMSGFGSSGLK